MFLSNIEPPKVRDANFVGAPVVLKDGLAVDSHILANSLTACLLVIETLKGFSGIHKWTYI